MLFIKECRKVVCSAAYWLYLAMVVVMYVSQFTSELDIGIQPPSKGLESYEWKSVELPELMMPAATEGLVSEYLSGSYQAYPFGFYKEVKLSGRKREEMAELIETLAGISKEELEDFQGYQEEGYGGVADQDGNIVLSYQEAVLPELHIPEDMSYERFRELMRRADKLIGGGSRYSDEYIVGNFSNVPLTYEEAVAEYEELMQGENLGKGYARLFCDYTGIILAIMPVFVCVSLWQMDKRAGMQQLIYSRAASSVRIVGTRYLALVFCTILPVILTFVHAMAGVKAMYPERDIALGSPVVLTAVWLIPELLTVLAAGALVSESLSPLYAIFVQGIWWFLSLSANQLTGSITRYTLLIRHNNVGKAGLFEARYSEFLWNRGFYMILSAAALGLTVLLYDRHRREEKRRVQTDFKCKSKA
ncbi:MAG: hypothetical protein NC092_14100 [Butyrivibrio sp.]|nr:hypothetical protein [Muribaculum sp.]MCM1553801.1 hypothetical protein [Butyrivibrio sp.]